MREGRQTTMGEPDQRPGPRYATSKRSDVRQAGPGHRYRHYIKTVPATLRELSADLDVPSQGRILDYGSAEAPYRDFFPPSVTFISADLPGNPDAAVELKADGTLPTGEGEFDALLSTQVLEHVEDPGLYLSECFRVLRPGGRMLLSTHGTFVYHPDPDDYWRWTSAGLRRQVSAVGFEIERFEGIIGLLATGLQLAQDAVYWRLPKILRAPTAFVMQSLIALADRLQGAESRRLDASVFALVARKP
jgi:SAM-dependent methyltransferase